MLQFVLSLMLLINRRQPEDDLRTVARAIAAVCTEPVNARALVTLHFMENGLNPRNGLPFGLTAFPTRGVRRTLTESARIARGVWLRGRRLCGSETSAFTFYVTGRCSPVPSDARRHPNLPFYSRVFTRLGLSR